MSSKTVAIFGLGKLGVPMAACFASKGHRVIGVDIDSQVVKKINQGMPPFFEPGLCHCLCAQRARIEATVDHAKAVSKADISFVVVPTPSCKDGSFQNRFVTDCMEKIGGALRKKKAYHLVVLTSTVLPGTTEKEIFPILENRSGKKCGRDFGLCYNPEFIALGNVIHDILNPDFVLIGESDPKAGSRLSAFYNKICDHKPPIARMNWVNAELTKLCVNTYVTTKISYANMLAEICEKIPGADVDIVTKALSLDTRIGFKYLKGALGYGGPCFPRDNAAFDRMATKLGLKADIPRATDYVNQRQVKQLAAKILACMPRKGTVGILGLAYKPNTGVVECSQGLELATMLIGQGVRVVLFDPLALDNAKKYLGGKAVFASTPLDCIQKSDVIVITIPCAEFKKIKPSDFIQKKNRQTLFDCWRILDRARFSKVVDYRTLGAGVRKFGGDIRKRIS